jgi:hypothetical protein
MTAVQRKYGPTGPTGPQGEPSFVTGPTGPSGLDNFTVTLTSPVTYAINTLNGTQYGMANYVIRGSQGTDRIASDFKILHNSTDIDWVEYASLNIGTLEIVFTADFAGTDIILYAQCSTATSENPVEIKIIRTKF